SKLFFTREGKIAQRTSEEYISGAPGKPAADEAQRKRTIDWIDVTGDAAVAKITLTYPAVTFTDYMSLLKVDGEWKIVNKLFHADRKK
ncbi:MAG TPA: nuclear transport factor 2 family protein, partial [Thermoanaerobaculia bacterium]|nr:nuclear transport factor 2 family protein [Thermoanaerobaculia bacterium]